MKLQWFLNKLSNLSWNQSKLLDFKISYLFSMVMKKKIVLKTNLQSSNMPYFVWKGTNYHRWHVVTSHSNEPLWNFSSSAIWFEKIFGCLDSNWIELPKRWFLFIISWILIKRNIKIRSFFLKIIFFKRNPDFKTTL